MNKIKKLFKESINIKQEILNSNILNVIERMGDEISYSIKNGGKMMLCGNGGSASIANHLKCDFMKGIRTNTSLVPNVVSLSTNIEIITAISNDISYEEIFSYQLS